MKWPGAVDAAPAVVRNLKGVTNMGIRAYNRGTAALSAQLDREAAERRQSPIVERCLCGASHLDGWTAGVHHGAHRCARVVSKVSP